MKRNVVDISDLESYIPLFRSKWGHYLAKKLFKWLNIDKVNEVHSRNSDLRGAAFTSALLNDSLIDLKYRIHNKEVLDHLPEGAFATVSNHPIGSLDGIILIDIFATCRPDFKVMVNGVLTLIGAMEDNFIPVKPDSSKQGANPENINGVRLSLARLKEGHPMGFFPAGAMSFYNNRVKQVRDLPWTHSVVRLIRKGHVPVIPVYFDFLNTRFFYFLGKVNWKIRSLRVPTEVFNKKGKIVDVYLGDPIPVEEIQRRTDDTILADFLYQATYNAKKKTF